LTIGRTPIYASPPRPAVDFGFLRELCGSSSANYAVKLFSTGTADFRYESGSLIQETPDRPDSDPTAKFSNAM